VSDSVDITSASARSFAAFISYSHSDEPTAKWLQGRLEAFRVPPALRARARARGFPGKRLGKVFRDRSDLSAAHDLSGEIRDALTRAGHLLVLCSPAACSSAYVNEEIRVFKALGGAERIIAAIVPAGGADASDAVAFPASLVNRLEQDGAVSTTAEAIDPLAADFRDGKDGRENGFLKIVAGMLDVDLDDLVLRERQAERARRRVAYAIASVMVVLAIGAGIGGVRAYNAEMRARNELARVLGFGAWTAMRAGDFQRAVQYAVAGLASYPANEQDYRAALAAALFGIEDSSPLMGHSGPVTSAAFDVSGAYVMTASNDGTARIYSVADPQHVHRLAHEKAVTAARFSPNGLLAVTASLDGTARLWDVASGQALHTFAPQDGPIRDAAFAHDGARVATATASTVRLWDVGTGAQIGPALAHQGAVSRVLFDSTGAMIAAVTPRAIALWRAHDGAALGELAAPDVLSLAFSPDGRFLVTGSKEENLGLVWNLQTRESIALRGHDGDIVSVAVSADGRRAITGSKDETARVWNMERGSLCFELRGHHDDVVSVAFDRTGDRIVTASEDGTARVWYVDEREGDVPRAHELVVLRGHEAAVLSAAFSGDDRSVVTASKDETARIWSAQAGREVARFAPRVAASEADVLGASLSPDGAFVAAASRDGGVRVWRRRDGALLSDTGATGADARHVAFDGAGRRLASVSYDGLLRLWSVQDGVLSPLAQANLGAAGRPPARGVMVVFSPDGQRLLVSVRGEPAQIWALSDDGRLSRSGVIGENVWSAVFSSNGARIATASANGLVEIWSSAPGYERQIAPLAGHTEGVRSVTFGRDDQVVVSGSEDETVRVWDVSPNPVGNRMLAVFREHTGAVRSAAFHPTLPLAVTGSTDNTVRIWDVEAGRDVAVLTGHLKDVQSVSFDHTGAHLLTGSDDGTVRIWDVRHFSRSARELREEACQRVVLARLSSRTFSADAFGADLLLESVWVRDGRTRASDICAGVSGTSPLSSP